MPRPPSDGANDVTEDLNGSLSVALNRVLKARGVTIAPTCTLAPKIKGFCDRGYELKTVDIVMTLTIRDTLRLTQLLNGHALRARCLNSSACTFGSCMSTFEASSTRSFIPR